MRGLNKEREAPCDVQKKREMKSERLDIERCTVGCTKGARDKE